MTELEALEEELKKVKKENLEAFKKYGSQLAIGEMIKQEQILETRIKELKKKK